jgi:PAS domain S-box-containing protein
MKKKSEIQLFFQGNSIKRKLTAVIMICACSAMLLVSMTLFSYEVYLSRQHTLFNVTTITNLVGSYSNAALIFNDSRAANEGLSMLKNQPHILLVCLFRNDGTLLASFTQAQSNFQCPQASPDLGYHFTNNGLDLTQSILFEGEGIGKIFVKSDLRTYYQRLEPYTIIVLCSVFLSFFISLGLSNVLQKAISDPIIHLAGLAKRISAEKNYSIRARKITQTEDEIGILIDGFNQMLAQIEVQNQALRTSNEALRKTDEELRSFIDNSIALISLKDARGYYHLVNRAFCQTFGIERDKILDLTDYDLFGSASHSELWKLHHQSVIKTHTPHTWEETLEHHGSRFTYISTYFPLLDAEGSLYGVGKISTDITERKAIESERIQMLEQQRHAILMRDEFMLLAAHELRTPLTPLKVGLRVFSNLLKSPVVNSLPEATHLNKTLSILNQQIDRFSKLVESMLDISRINSGQLIISKENTDISQLVAHILDKFRSEFEKAKCPLKVNVVQGIRLFIDPFRLEQVIDNLLSNAIKYGPGSLIEINLYNSDAKVILSIRDQGIGIAHEDQDRIFSRFERAVSLTQFGGLGLGLYISRQIVTAHSGKIWVESGIGQGSTFYVELPTD